MQPFAFSALANLKTRSSNRSYQFIRSKVYYALITGDDFVIAKVEGRTGRARGIYNINNVRVKIQKNTYEILVMTPEEHALYPVDFLFREPPLIVGEQLRLR